MPQKICPKCGKDITCPWCQGKRGRKQGSGRGAFIDPCRHCGGSGRTAHDCTPYIAG